MEILVTNKSIFQMDDCDLEAIVGGMNDDDDAEVTSFDWAEFGKNIWYLVKPVKRYIGSVDAEATAAAAVYSLILFAAGCGVGAALARFNDISNWFKRKFTSNKPVTPVAGEKTK